MFKTSFTPFYLNIVNVQIHLSVGTENDIIYPKVYSKYPTYIYIYAIDTNIKPCKI